MRKGRKRKYRKGDIGFHHYAFELASRKAVDELGAFLEKNGMTVLDPPGEYYGDSYYAVYFADPDGMKLEAMIWAPAEEGQAPHEICALSHQRRRLVDGPAASGSDVLTSVGALASTRLRPRRLAA